jgi:RNA polymerase II subunit A-like phosphatase
MALWRRLDETPYLLDEPPATVGLSSSPAADDHQISSDPDPDTDDWDENDDGEVVDRVVGVGGGVEPKSFEIEEINWNDINDEVEAAMNESDDEEEDGRSDVSAMRSVQCSEDEASSSDRLTFLNFLHHEYF